MELAQKLAEVTPRDLWASFFTYSGSSTYRFGLGTCHTTSVDARGGIEAAASVTHLDQPWPDLGRPCVDSHASIPNGGLISDLYSAIPLGCRVPACA